MDHARLMVVWFSLSESSVANVKFLAEPEQTLIRVLTFFFVQKKTIFCWVQVPLILDCFSRCDS